MNLIELFESKPFQDVGTFNSIFKASPILGFSASSEVEICGVTAKGRRLLVDGAELFLDLLANERVEKLERVKPTKKRIRKYRTPTKVLGALPEIFHKLSPGEFMIFHALKIVGEVKGVYQFSTIIPMERRTIQNMVTSLEAKGFVTVERNGNDAGRISLTQQIK